MTLTAQQLHDIVKANPEAWPEGVAWMATHFRLDSVYLHDSHAMMLHEAAAMRYLLDNHGWHVRVARGTTTYIVEVGAEGIHAATARGMFPTLIEALHKAISASKK